MGGEIVTERTALLIVDPQKCFCPGGPLAVPDGDGIFPRVNEWIEIAFTERPDQIYVSRDWHPADSMHFLKWPVHGVQNTPDAEFHPALRLPPEAHIVSKGMGRTEDGYSAMDGVTEDGTPLPDALHARGFTDLYVVGLATEFCVLATVLDGLKHGFHVIVDPEGIRALDDLNGRLALDQMADAGAIIM